MKQTTEEKKAYHKEYDARPDRKAANRARKARFRASPNGKATNRACKARYYATLEGRAKTMLGHARQRAKERGGVCTLTPEWVMAGIEAGCALSGHAFVLTGGKHGRAPSIDRIDNSSPDYTPENSRVILARINNAINAHGQDAYLEDARDVFKHLGIYINDPKLEALLTTMQGVERSSV